MADIFTGIMLILFGIGLFAFGLFMKRQKTGNYELHDGTITSVNSETRDIAVTYKADEKFYSASHHIPDFEDMPEIDLKVCVMTYAGNPQKVVTIKFMREMGRGTSHKYIDNNSTKNFRQMISGSILFLVGGIAFLLDGLNII